MAKQKQKKEEKAERKIPHEKPISLYPLKPEEALKKLLLIIPPRKKKKPMRNT